MIRHRINRLPVIEDRRLVGIITRGDIIEGLAKL
jgi:CBS domain-containing protein